jgi:membrane-anchored mycosin MYCP
LGLVVGSAPPAAAASDLHPTKAEWWFPPYSIEEKVWPVTQGQGVTVAVLGGGVNTKLPEIAGATLRGGDVLGRNRDGHTDLSEYGHSTSMAVLIAGQGGGRSGLVGIAPRSKILPVGVDGGDITVDTLAKPLADGIRFAVDKGAQVINMSLAAPATEPDYCPPEVMAAISYAVEHDVVLVAGAGNEGDTSNMILYPASCPAVLSVGATDDHSRPWRSTQVNDYVSVAAPGVRMPALGKDPDFYYAETNGTSNSAALVSGAAALVRSANPDLPAREVVHRMIATALDVNTPGPDGATGYGIVRIGRSMDVRGNPVAADSPNPPYERLDRWFQPASAASAEAAASASASASAGTAVETPADRGPNGTLIALVVLASVAALAGAGWLVAARRRRSTGSHPPAAIEEPEDQAPTA